MVGCSVDFKDRRRIGFTNKHMPSLSLYSTMNDKRPYAAKD